jgi:hypothetical protein
MLPLSKLTFDNFASRVCCSPSCIVHLSSFLDAVDSAGCEWLIKMRWFFQNLRWLRFIFALVLFAGPLWWGYRQTDTIRESYQKPPVVSSAESSQGTNQAATRPESKTIPEPVNQQNKQMIDWGILLLSGCIALLTTVNVHSIKYHEWWYCFFVAPAAGFLLSSLWCGVIFQQRVAYLSLQAVHRDLDLDALLSFLQLQSSLLACAIFFLGLFAFVFLIAIVLGAVNPLEKP